MAMEAVEGSALSAQSRAGIAATDIQSTAASRPIRAADNWLTTVEKVLLIRPRQIAARHLPGSGVPAPDGGGFSSHVNTFQGSFRVWLQRRS
jgi:hypothetical protein